MLWLLYGCCSENLLQEYYAEDRNDLQSLQTALQEKFVFFVLHLITVQNMGTLKAV